MLHENVFGLGVLPSSRYVHHTAEHNHHLSNLNCLSDLLTVQEDDELSVGNYEYWCTS
jgi:hypothetical protein